ncbi:acetyltransferase [Phlyctema vagabunda]|uniref:Acetyltransferase n=1 Tax=Phlyctema vagabunda TaxID=108571 RepID=A0ABR4PXF3_9HELO
MARVDLGFPNDFILSPARVEDVPGMVAAVLSAFSKSEATRLNMGTASQAAKESWLTSNLTTKFTTPGVYQFVVRQHSTDKIVGMSRWLFPTVLTEEQQQDKANEAEENAAKRQRGENPYPEGANVGSFDAMFDGANRFRGLHVNPEDTYVLDLLCVHQDYQGKGIGGMLLRYALDLADADGRKAYLESTEAGHPLYLKLGWKDIDLLTIDTRNYGGEKVITYWIMTRDPRALIKAE